MKNDRIRILLVEDDQLTARLNKRLLSQYGEVIVANCIQEAHEKIVNEKCDIGFFDLNLYGKLDGLKLLKLAKLKNIYSIVLSGEVDKTVLEESFRNGARDYLNKPFDQIKLESVLNRFINFQKNYQFENLINEQFITKSKELTEELYKIKNLSFSTKPIFVSGETGTGKRVVAHIIKKVLKPEKFVEINCSQYTDELFASELFGHTSGAFTGATKDKKGLLELADNGIIFLDEIHALSPRAQKTLLKAIEEKEFYPVGSERKIKSNFRVISATCENIHQLVQFGEFRQDLFARISTFSINISPIRDRIEDIPLLFEHFISKQPFRIIITDEAYELLKAYSWPQNTREIQDLIENWVIHGQRLISPEVLPTRIKNNLVTVNNIISDFYLDMAEEMGLREFMLVFKKELIKSMIKRHGGVAKYAAKAMSTSYPNLINYMKTNENKSFNTRSLH